MTENQAAKQMNSEMATGFFRKYLKKAAYLRISVQVHLGMVLVVQQASTLLFVQGLIVGAVGLGVLGSIPIHDDCYYGIAHTGSVDQTGVLGLLTCDKLLKLGDVKGSNLGPSYYCHLL